MPNTHDQPVRAPATPTARQQVMDELFAAVQSAVQERPVDEDLAVRKQRHVAIKALIRAVDYVTQSTESSRYDNPREGLFGNIDDHDRVSELAPEFVPIFLEFHNAIVQNCLHVNNSAAASLVVCCRRMLKGFQDFKAEPTPASLSRLRMELILSQMAHNRTIIALLRNDQKTRATAFTNLALNLGVTVLVDDDGHFTVDPDAWVTE
ncbi:uncharacterized protein LOC62_07G009444 [Vanrija pseudolonga]|uniref:Uncharacterized protein n=1 Tax=Vanrija pseudolonga TaxID=143232 RepID=A0AAF0YFM5_9TREE|nr:hypothetical protein LOC62_07G009444 [Vanrija pseudolonga]